jgi:hypothetical protein
MRREAHFQEQVARLAVLGSHFLALPRKADVLAGLDAARDPDVQRALAKLRPAAGIGLRNTQAQQPAAAFERSLEIDDDARVMILAAAATPLRVPRAEPRAAAEQRFEELTRITLERETLFVRPTPAGTAELEARVEARRGTEILAWARTTAELVVGRALLRIPQHLVRFAQLLEACLGVLLLADVGVVLARELAVGLLDLLGRGIARHSHDRVVVLELHPRLRCP